MQKGMSIIPQVTFPLAVTSLMGVLLSEKEMNDTDETGIQVTAPHPDATASVVAYTVPTEPSLEPMLPQQMTRQTTEKRAHDWTLEKGASKRKNKYKIKINYYLEAFTEYRKGDILIIAKGR